MNILLDYFFPITAIEPTPQASTGFLKQVCLVVKPADAVPSGLTACTTMAAVEALTDNTEAEQLFNAGMSKVFILVNADLDIASILDANQGEFYTVLISSDFTKTDVTTDLDVGTFTGVVGVSDADDTYLAAQAAISKRSAFHTTSVNKAKNLCYAFGKLLSNALNWRNNQYITMPVADDVNTIGLANTLFDDKISFVISDEEFGERLALFAAGGKAIVEPYIKRNLEIDMQSAALSYVSGNQPQYTKKEAALLEDTLQKVINSYIEREWIEAGTVEVKLEQSNFVASGYINISEPKALWRIFSEIQQTL